MHLLYYHVFNLNTRIIPYHSKKIKKVLLTKQLEVSIINTCNQDKYRLENKRVEE